MTKGQMLRGDVDAEVGLTSSTAGTFNTWLQSQLHARKLTQRQLAHKSGVDHSTISRLLREDRMPSLRTATLLVRGLDVPVGAATSDGRTFGRASSRAAGVEYALRSDEMLSEAQVREIMHVYLAARLRHVRRAAAAPQASTRRAPVPIVVQVPALRSRSGPGDSPPDRVVARADARIPQPPQGGRGGRG